MRFYGREEEIALLQDCWTVVQTNQVAQMVTVMGRPRVGKTTLILKAFDGLQKEVPVFYFFAHQHVTQKALVSTWLAEIGAVYRTDVPPAIETVGGLLKYLMSLAKVKPCVCIFDECQAFERIDPNIWSQIQKVWDLNKNQTPMLLVMSGTERGTKAIFYNYQQPLYGRPSYQLLVKAFTPQVVKAIVYAEYPQATAMDVLAVYSITGGVATYIEILVEAQALSVDAAMGFICSARGMWLRAEGEIYLANAFPSEAVTYHEILGALAQGKDRWRDLLESVETASQLSPYLNRLERFGMIEKLQPIFEGGLRKNSKYRIVDQYLLFWLSLIAPLAPKSMAEAGNWSGLLRYMKERFPQFFGRSLERWFIEAYRHAHQWEVVDGWWDKQGSNEIDLVAVDTSKKIIEFAEVKLNPQKYDDRRLHMKAAAFLEKHSKFKSYDITIRGLSPEDI